MTIKDIAYKISNIALQEKRPVSKLQTIRSKNLKITPNTWHIFSERSVKDKENYAFHSGGRKEFQFNIAQDWIKGNSVFRYGLAFSLKEDKTLHDSKAEFRPKIERFNNFILDNPTYFEGYSMWYYSNGKFGEYFDNVKPIDELMFQAENFIFIGKFINKELDEINISDIDIVLNSFDNLIIAYEEIEFGKNKIEKRIARLTWNKNGWIKPSGPEGKSKNIDTHEGQFGYGHEEWLFDTSKLIDGYHYGFLEPIRKQQQSYIGNSYNIWLYTIDNISKKRFWIGEINNVEVIDNSQAEKIKLAYIERKWYQEMEFQISDCGANPNGFSDYNGVDLFNIRFSPHNIKFNSEYFELPRENKIYEQSRYTFANFTDDLIPKKVIKNFAFSSDKETDDNHDSKVKTSTYDRQPKAVEVAYVHQAICNGLKIKLKEQYGSENVSTELHAGYGQNRIDLVVQNGSEYVFYEIKAYNSTRTSIREAIGQLFEYCFWTDKKNANKLVIITQKLGDLEDAKIYIQNLRSILNFPIYFQTYDLTKEEISEEY